MTEVVRSQVLQLELNAALPEKENRQANAPFPNALQCYTFCTDRFIAIFSVAGERYCKRYNSTYS